MLVNVVKEIIWDLLMQYTLEFKFYLVFLWKKKVKRYVTSC